MAVASLPIFFRDVRLGVATLQRNRTKKMIE